MDYRDLIPTLGVNEDIRPPPYPDDVTNMDAMAKMEGQALGRVCDRPRSWIIIIGMWLALGMPMVGMTIYLFLITDLYNLEFFHYFIGIFMILLCIIVHVPVIQSVVIKVRSNKSLKGRM
jgi:hypothetical protein